MKLSFSFAAVAAALATAPMALAQGAPPVDFTQEGFTIRGGAAFPIDRTVSDIQTTFANIGIEYQPLRNLLRNAETFIAVDLFFRSLEFDRDTVFPITIGQRFYGRNMEFGRRNYIFAGVGVAFTDFGTSKTSGTFRIGAGQELGQNTIFELGLTIVDRVNGIRPNFLTVNIGYRF